MKKIIGIIFLTFLTTGCASTNLPPMGVQTFGLATDQAGRLGEDEFIHMRNDIIAMNRAMSTLDLTPVSGIVYGGQADASFVAGRMAACKALRYYGDILIRLSMDDRTGLVLRSATMYLENLQTALQDVPPASLVHAIENLQTCSTRSAGARERAVAELAISSEHIIAALVDMLQAGLMAENGSYLQQYEQTAQKLKQSAMAIIDGGPRYTIMERQLAVDGYFLGEQAQTRSRELSSKLVHVFDELKASNTTLIRHARSQTLQQADFSSFGRLLRQTGNMQEVLTESPSL